MFIINGKSQASTVRLAVGTGCVHQEMGYCLTDVPCHMTCRTDEDLKAWSTRSWFDPPPTATQPLLSFAYYSTVYRTWSFSQWVDYEVQLVDKKHQIFWRLSPSLPSHAHLMTRPYERKQYQRLPFTILLPMVLVSQCQPGSRSRWPSVWRASKGHW